MTQEAARVDIAVICAETRDILKLDVQYCTLMYHVNQSFKFDI